MPLKKVLTFNRKEDFYMDIKYSNPERLPKCGTPQHELRPDTTALVTSDCDAMRSPSIKRP